MIFNQKNRMGRQSLEAKTSKSDNDVIEPQNGLNYSTHPKISYLRWIPLISQFCLAVLISLLTATVVEISNEIIASLFMGFLLVQILLSSVWIALAPLNFITRVVSSTVVTLFFTLCMYKVAWRDGGGHSVAIGIVGPMLIHWLLFQIPLWAIRFMGWKFRISNPQICDDRRAEFQFGIKHLLIWTTIVAMFLAITKVIVSGVDFELGGGIGESLATGLPLTLGNGLIAVPIIWGCLVKHYFWVWIFISILLCTFVTSFEMWLYGLQVDYEFFVSINLSQTLLGIFAMSAVRMTGYRLERSS